MSEHLPSGEGERFISMEEARYLPIEARTDELNQLQALSDEWGENLTPNMVRMHLTRRRAQIVALAVRPADAEITTRLPESPEMHDLYGRTARGWHSFLTGDNLDTPGSRFGRKASDCAWWAVAGLYVYKAALGEPDEVEVMASDLMSSAVNGNEDLARFVTASEYSVPIEVWVELRIDGEGVSTRGGDE